MSMTIGSAAAGELPSEAVETAIVTETAGYELVIEPRRGWIAVNWAEMSHFRELLGFLIWRDVKVRYKQTALGVAWAILVPLFNMLIFTVIFGRFGGMDTRLSPGENYSVFVFGGLLPWTFFSSAISLGGLSLVNQQQLLSKIYFPRLFVPASAVGGALVDLLISFGVMAVLLAVFRVMPSWQVVAILPLVVMLVVASLGIAFALSALTVTYRDFRFIVQFMVQAWMFLSPVMYPVRMFPPRYQWILALNPMCGIIEGFRSALLTRYEPWRPLDMAISSASSIALFVFGLYYFRKTERRFADIA